MKRLVIAILLLTAVVSSVLLLARPGAEASPDATITVDSTADTDARDGALTLREAMLLATEELAVGDLDAGEADNVSGTPGAASADTIVFDTTVFPPGTPATISPGSTLPTLSTGNDTVDGSAAGVIIDGSGASWNSDCFVITSANNTIKGLEIYNWWFGVGIGSGARSNTIGGTTPGEGNVISANGWGVVIGGSGTDGNVLKGNYIGSDASGALDIGNGHGVLIWVGAQNNTIGGRAAGEGNVIAYNIAGLTVQSDDTTGNTISGNSIHSNSVSGINNVFGGNEELDPPIVDSAGSVPGHTEPKCYPCTVEVFSDDEAQGRIYHGSTTTNDDPTGTWSYAGAVTGPNITATITDVDGNTSEFSAPFSCGPDSDGDGLGDACDPCPANPDCDDDSLGLGPSGGFFRDSVELFIGTDPLDDCADTSDPNDETGVGESPWPPDFNDNGSIEIGDLVGLKNHWVPLGNPYDVRYDLNATGNCDIGDLVALKQYWTGGGYDTCVVG